MNNKELVKDFKQAKKLLSAQDYFYSHICHVLKTKPARAVIAERIRPAVVLRRWLLSNTDIQWEELTNEAMYEYNQRWLDSLIEEFSGVPK